MQFIITFSCLNITVVSHYGQTQTPYCRGHGESLVISTPVLPVFSKFLLTILGKFTGSCSIKFLPKMTHPFNTALLHTPYKLLGTDLFNVSLFQVQPSEWFKAEAKKSG